MTSTTEDISKGIASIKLFGSGSIYKVQMTNASYSNLVLTDIGAAIGTGNAPIFAVNNIDEDQQSWEYDSFKNTIKNTKTGLFAYPETQTTGARILERKATFIWDVVRDSSGYTTIGLPGQKIYWTLKSDDNYGFVTLQAQIAGDDSGKWVFNNA